jgi:hypothetical protein
VSDIDTIAMGGLKALDPNWPIREADIEQLNGCADGTFRRIDAITSYLKIELPLPCGARARPA